MRKEDIKVGMRVVARDTRGTFRGVARYTVGVMVIVSCDDRKVRSFYPHELTRLVPKRKKLTVECDWSRIDGIGPVYPDDHGNFDWKSLIGERTKLTIEILDDTPTAPQHPPGEQSSGA